MERKVSYSELAHVKSLPFNIPPCKRTEPVSFEGCLSTPPASSWIISRTRRSFDIFIALFALIISAIPMLIIAICVRITSKGEILFSQNRMGLGGRLFRIHKFRSMAENRGKNAGHGLTMDGDLRVTPIGRFIRKFKLDELPQFYNVLRGDMSLVGPRPKMPRYAGFSKMPYRPGITGVATVAFRCEGEILRSVDADRMDLFYTEQIKPLKARLDACYMCGATPFSDICVLASTALSCIMPEKVPVVTHATLTSVRTKRISGREALQEQRAAEG